MFKGKTLCATKQPLTADLKGELMILDTTTGHYYGLNAVATYIWQLLQEPIKYDDLVNVLLDEYNISREQCEEDLLSLLADLYRTNLIEIMDESSS